MIRLVTDYLTRLIAGFGAGWTRFWFTPSDPTMLSLIRLLTGLVVVYLHATLTIDLVTLFGPDGLLPADAIAPLEAGSFSYLNLLSTPGELLTVHLLGLVVLAMFAAGFLTPITTILSLVVFLSDVHRATMITSRTESIVAFLMCYLCLAPSGRYFSVDAWLNRKKPLGAATLGGQNELSTLATISTRLIQVHLALWVAMTSFSMLAADTWWTGMGTWWLIARPESRLVDLTWLTPKVVYFWTHLVVLFGLAFPVLVWVPLARPLMLAWAVLVWTSLALVTGETTFALSLCIAALAFVSPAFARSCLHAPRPTTAAAAVR